MDIEEDEIYEEGIAMSSIFALVLSKIPDKDVIWGLSITGNEIFEHFEEFGMLRKLLIDMSFEHGGISSTIYLPMIKQVKDAIISLSEREPYFWCYMYHNILFDKQNIYYRVVDSSSISILDSIGISEKDIQPYDKYFTGGIRLAPASEM